MADRGRFIVPRYDPAATLRIFFEGVEVPAVPGQSVAAALLAVGVLRFRANPVSGAPRGPYCMMGACFDCLVTIDGVPNAQACMTEVRDGMWVEIQDGARDPAGPHDLGEEPAT
jgi:succinate dehydrogenase/fumarate reductase-like Fe-S protein